MKQYIKTKDGIVEFTPVFVGDIQVTKLEGEVTTKVAFDEQENLKETAKAKAQADALIEARKNREVPRYAGRAALIKAGLMPKLLEAIELIKDPKEKLLVENEINERPTWKRSSDFLNGFAKKLGLTDKQVDDLFDATEKEI